MSCVLIVFSFLLHANAFAAPDIVLAGPINNQTQPGSAPVITDFKGIKILNCEGASGASRCTFRTPNGTSGYTLATGHYFVAIGGLCYNASGVSGACYVYETDNDVGQKSSTAFTNPFSKWASSNSGGAMYIYPLTLSANKYLSGQINCDNCYLVLYGYEI